MCALNGENYCGCCGNNLDGTPTCCLHVCSTQIKCKPNYLRQTDSKFVEHKKNSKLKNRSGIESKLRENRVVLVAAVQKTIEIYKNFESFTVKWHTEAKKCEFNYGVIS